MARFPHGEPDAYEPIGHYFETRGRAAEIARGRGSGSIRAEHFFLGMLHDDNRWSAIRTLARTARLDVVETAVLAVLDSPDYDPPPPPEPPRPLVMPQPWGIRAAVRMGQHTITVDHAFLDMLAQRDTVPARALASLGLDLDALAEAVETAMTTEDPVPDGAVYFPDGQELDEELRRALVTTMPRDTGLSLSPGSPVSGGRPWIKVQAGDATAILNTALASLGRPTLP